MIQLILNKILEGFDIVSFCAALFYAAIGMLVARLIASNKRNVDNPNSPRQHSYGYMLKDNVIRISSAMIFIMVLLRFSDKFLGQTVTSWLGFGLGLLSDYLGGWIQQIMSGLRCQVKEYLDKIFPQKKDQSNEMG